MAGRAARLEEMERNKKLNVDNIGTVVKDFTSINRRESTSDVLPDSLDVGMGRASLEETAAAATTAAAKGGASTSSSSASSSSGGGGGASKRAAATAAATAAASGGKKEAAVAAVKEVGPHSEMEAAESYNNFALKHEVRICVRM